MAKILYGVHGSQHGHAIRATVVARHLPHHEFLFISSEEGAELLGREFRVERFENPGTRYRKYKVDTLATVALAARTLARRGRELDRLARIIDDFKPDAAISDYEYFVPIAAKRANIPCLSLDHQHVISCCAHDIPAALRLDYYGILASIRFLFSNCTDYLAISFYQPPVKPGLRARIAPPILRDSVFRFTPTDGDHILVYQSCSICDAFVPFLKTLDREFRVYGYDMDRTEGNLTFRGYSEEGLLADLSSCAYVMCGGGHNLMSEALSYGKPIMSFPVGGAVEQHLNAVYLEKLGYGRHLDMMRLSKNMVSDFEAALPSRRAAIRAANFRGNELVFDLVEGFVKTGRLALA
ncbi:glycosyltransferase family protein [Desulfolutivibrio sulfoxidireducens]|uniref:glycosyltransferase family protein n=1 Tax=Desulfolutivibrio sulfoxidireducens TaxID=2773299 RepID=UPI00159EADD0|nr:glycosyltransferase family protein [Desulfolutivibrio sulfoxidireducens]QLA17661.1 hypothetical protein GD605_17045 [Desulfolutivibrio sulfoxidireducens]QLA21230.1 hypothetical protein GD604_16620 [Desulfolutivibrio sulfoxidireducens]